ncbi:MAG: hypothetical protein PVF45_00605, partial [Anaerolineae bacterium]
MVRLSISSNRISPSCRWWLLAGLALFVIVALLCILVLIPAGVRALPGRHAARLPGFLQDLRHRPHPHILPTPAISVTSLTLWTPSLSSSPVLPRLSGVTIVTATPPEREKTPTPTTPRPTLTPTLPLT